MRKAGLAAVVVLVIGSSSAAFGGSVEDLRSPTVAKSESSLSLSQVSRLKAVLKLTAEQEPLWPAIERAFREISQAQDGAAQGFVQRMKSRVASVGLNALAMQRLAAAAYPLLRTLTEEQKQSGLVFARSTGLDKFAAAF